MAEAVILSKIASLKRCVDRIESKIPADADILLRDWDIQDIIVLNLERAVQICTDIAAHITADTDMRPPATMSEGFDRLYEAGIISMPLSERMKKAWDSEISRFMNTNPLTGEWFTPSSPVIRATFSFMQKKFWNGQKTVPAMMPESKQI